MNIEDIRELIDLMKENDLLEVELEESGRKIRLKKRDDQLPPAVEFRAPSPLAVPMAPEIASESNPVAQNPPGVKTIHSPMVGTFYRASGPDADNFVEVGDPVNEETVVSIIEAMKVMNEIKAELTGTVHEILVANGEPVEYGQPLFLIHEGSGSA